jgi:DNA anti-recombination protein RmuC
MAHDSATTSHDALNASPAAIAAAPAAASSETVENTRPVTTLRPVPVVPSPPTGRAIQIADTAEVEWLAEEEALTPFRVFRSFDYSVSLLFHARELAYYVALYQEGALWRALKAADLDAAEAAFHHFEEQATRLSEGETRRAQLAAQNEQLARMIAQSEAQAERLRCDLQRNAAQEQRVAAQAQLNKAHRQIHQLNLTSNEGVPHLHGR